jgi:hypothetical protein
LHRIRLADLIEGEAQATLSLRRHLQDTVDELLSPNTITTRGMGTKPGVESAR